VSGVRAHADILRLVASLLVLQLMRVRKLDEGKLLLSLFRLDLDHSPPQPRYSGSPLSAPLYNTPSTLFYLQGLRAVQFMCLCFSWDKGIYVLFLFGAFLDACVCTHALNMVTVCVPPGVSAGRR
jgi:hypothetical protein